MPTPPDDSQGIVFFLAVAFGVVALGLLAVVVAILHAIFGDSR